MILGSRVFVGFAGGGETFALRYVEIISKVGMRRKIKFKKVEKRVFFIA